MRKEKLPKPEWPDLFDEPRKWRELQESARRETNPEKLEQIVAEMNHLLTEYEKRAETQKRSTRRKK
jgi:hypothetical protein